MRAHFNRALLDQQGNQVSPAQVRVLAPGGTDSIGVTIYTDAAGGTTYTNPWTTTTGEVDFYLDAPARVRIGVTAAPTPEEFWDNVDVTAVGNDSPHPGSGSQSLQIGTGAAATGVSSTALGQGTQATDDQATAIGEAAVASASAALAIGSQSDATQPGAVALGQSALAQGSQSTAVGSGARAMYDQSTAIGSGAQTDRPNQVAVGTSDDMVFMPGKVVVFSPNGTAFQVAVTDNGMLYTQALPPYEEPPAPDEGGGE